MKSRKSLIYGSLVAAESIALVYFSLIPGLPFAGEPLVSYQDLVFHFAGYLIYGALAGKAFSQLGRGQRQLGRGRRILAALLLGSALGGVTEALQHFTPYRTASIIDWMADAAGSFFGGYAVSMPNRQRK